MTKGYYIHSVIVFVIGNTTDFTSLEIAERERKIKQLLSAIKSETTST